MLFYRAMCRLIVLTLGLAWALPASAQSGIDPDEFCGSVSRSVVRDHFVRPCSHCYMVQCQLCQVGTCSCAIDRSSSLNWGETRLLAVVTLGASIKPPLPTLAPLRKEIGWSACSWREGPATPPPR